ncbi:hypothetical protein B484DRAFT_449280, partial [Ochromonadaceae sp. CCMP2298]
MGTLPSFITALVLFLIAQSAAAMSRQTCYAAAKNKEVILEVLKPVCSTLRLDAPNRPLRVLEIASGTGEHANHFAENIPDLLYQPTEPEVGMHESISAWTSTVTQSQVLPPIALEAGGVLEDFSEVDLMVCINMIHISPWASTDALFRTAAAALRTQGRMVTYGPYCVQGEMVQSNMDFDSSLRARNPEWGIRDLEAVVEAAGRHNIVLSEKVSMPSNNLCLVWVKQ